MWWHSKIVRIKLIQNILKVIVPADAFEHPSCIRVLFLFRYENINQVHPIVPKCTRFTQDLEPVQLSPFWQYLMKPGLSVEVKSLAGM